MYVKRARKYQASIVSPLPFPFLTTCSVRGLLRLRLFAVAQDSHGTVPRCPWKERDFARQRQTCPIELQENRIVCTSFWILESTLQPPHRTQPKQSVCQSVMLQTLAHPSRAVQTHYARLSAFVEHNKQTHEELVTKKQSKNKRLKTDDAVRLHKQRKRRVSPRLRKKVKKKKERT